MITLRRSLLACAGSLLLAPFVAAAQADGRSSETPPANEAVASTPESEATKEDTAEAPKVCRSVRADPSSRRKSKVCRTAEEWRKLNIPT